MKTAIEWSDESGTIRVPVALIEAIQEDAQASMRERLDKMMDATGKVLETHAKLAELCQKWIELERGAFRKQFDPKSTPTDHYMNGAKRYAYQECRRALQEAAGLVSKPVPDGALKTP